MGWIIVGDTDKYEGCLVAVCYMGEEDAKKELDRMINNPTKNDLACIAGHTNLRLKHTEPKDEWWNDPFLAN